MSRTALPASEIAQPSQTGIRLRVERLLPWLVAAGSFGLNLLTARLSGFDGLYGQDAYAYFAHATELYQHGSLFHHWQWDAEPRLLYWPLGYPALVALFFTITGVSAQAAQLVSILAQALAAGLTTAITFRLGIFNSQFSTRLAALFAGGAMALSPLGRQAGLTIMADATALAFTCLAFWLVVEARATGRGLLMVVAGVALALAFSTRYAALAVLPALLIYDFRFTIYDLFNYVKCGTRPINSKDFNQPAILINRQSQFPDSKSPNRQSSIINRQFALLVAFSLVSLPQMVINFAWPKPFWNHPWLTGWSPLNYIKTAFDTPDGHAVYDRPPAVFYGLEPFWNLHFLTPLLIPLALAGFISLWARQRRSWQGWALVLWWLVPVLCYSGMPYENERFILTLLPPLAITGGLGLAALYDKVRSKKAEGRNNQESVESIDPDKIAVLPPVVTLNPKSFIPHPSSLIPHPSSLIPHPSSLILLTSAFLLLTFLCWVGQRHMEGFFAFKNDELNTVQAAEKVLPAGAQVLTFGVSLTYDHYYPNRPVFDLSATSESAIMGLLNQNRPLYLLAEPEVMESQFAATPIGASYRVARQLAVEPPLLEYKGYYLWRLRPGSNS